MPCSDGGPSSIDSQAVERDRRDKAAKELCDARALLIQLWECIPPSLRVSFFPNDQEYKYFVHYKAQQKHREHDKKMALKEAERESNQHIGRKGEIHRMGGEPTKSFNIKMKKLVDKVDLIKNSDPMHTLLY